MAAPQAFVCPDARSSALRPAQAQPAASPQSPAQPTSQRSPSPPASIDPPTPEQIGDSLSAHQRYQAAIAAYAKVTNPSAGVWNKMGIAYQMMFNLEGRHSLL